MIGNLHRIEQVSTLRAHRITSDEEERQRQGYEMITTLRYSEENGQSRVENVLISENDEQVLEIRYAPATTLWRINLGWRRRREKTVYGFSVDINSGEWTRDAQTPTDAEDDTVRDGKNIQRITPYVEDARNVLVLRPVMELGAITMVSLQYALKRGLPIGHFFTRQVAFSAHSGHPDESTAPASEPPCSTENTRSTPLDDQVGLHSCG